MSDLIQIKRNQWINPEVFYQAEEAEEANMYLDSFNIPRKDKNDLTYSLTGRIALYKDIKYKNE